MQILYKMSTYQVHARKINNTQVMVSICYCLQVKHLKNGFNGFSVI
jgi:hypothetical protein